MMKSTMTRLLCCLMAALLLVPMLSTALADPQDKAADRKDAQWFYPMLYTEGSLMHLLTDAQLDKIGALGSAEIHAIVEAMFLAAAGTKEYPEIQLWKTFRTVKEEEARSAENAAYREKTAPWLMAAYEPGNRPTPDPAGSEDANVTLVRPTPPPTPAPAVVPDPNAAPAAEPAWTPEDGMQAYAGNEQGKAFLELLKPLGGVDAPSCIAVSQAVVQRWLAELDHDELYRINDHYQCWLYASGTPIDYPVVQCRNNDYYLNRLFNRTVNPAGTLFIDYRNLPEFQDPNTLIYGHHMRDSSMFHSLTDFETEGFFDAHPFMVVVSKDEIYVVEVFAGYVTDSSDHCYDIAISDEKDMRRFVDLAKQKSDFNAHVDVDCKKDHVVTLSTCAYNFDNARYVVLGRLCLAWEREKTFFPTEEAAAQE